jgi:hypothetical protein
LRKLSTYLPTHLSIYLMYLICLIYVIYLIWLIYLINLHGVEPLSKGHYLSRHSRTSQQFMEPEVSVPCSQEPSNIPYPVESIPLQPISPRSVLIQSTHLRLVPTNNLEAVPFVLHALNYHAKLEFIFLFILIYCFFTIYSRYLKRVISERDGCEYLKQVPSIDGSL